MKKAHLKITNKLLMDLKIAKHKKMTSVRVNEKLYDYCRAVAKEKGWKLSDYFERLILAHAVAESSGKDLFALAECDFE